MKSEALPQPQVIHTNSIELSNNYSQRAVNNAKLHSILLDDGSVHLWISGLDIGNYADIVGPRRYAEHLRSLEPPCHKTSLRQYVGSILRRAIY